MKRREEAEQKMNSDISTDSIGLDDSKEMEKSEGKKSNAEDGKRKQLKNRPREVATCCDILFRVLCCCKCCFCCGLIQRKRATMRAHFECFCVSMIVILMVVCIPGRIAVRFCRASLYNF